MFLARKIRLAYAFFIVLLVGRWGMAEPAQQGSPVTNVQEELIGEKGPETSPYDREDTASPDGKRVAWRDKQGKKWFVVVDGEKTGAEYDEIESIVFSPDSQHFAFHAKSKKHWTMVLDGRSGLEGISELYKEIGDPRFSPDSQHLAYRAKRDKKWTMVLAGRQEGMPKFYKELGDPWFSPDSQHLAYRAKKDKEWLTVLDGKEGPVYDEVSDPVFSPDNQHLIYAAKRRKKWVLVVDGEEQGTEMDRGWEVLGFTPDKHEPIFVGWTDKGGSVFVGGQPGPAFDIISEPVFYPGGGKFVYAGARVKKPAMKTERAFGQVVIDGVASSAYEGRPRPRAGLGGMFLSWALVRGARPSFGAGVHGVSSPSVSPDGEHVAYAARRGKQDYVVVRDGDVIRSFNRIPCSPSFSPDGRLVYVGVEGDKLVVMVDGERLNEFVWEDVDDCSTISFPEGEHFIYAVAQGGFQYDVGDTSRAKRRVFVDGEAGKEYDALAVGNFQTLLTGPELQVAYTVHYDKYHDDASFVVVDGLEGKHYSVVYPTHFSGETTVSYIAQRERKFFRVTQSFR